MLISSVKFLPEHLDLIWAAEGCLSCPETEFGSSLGLVPPPAPWLPACPQYCPPPALYCPQATPSPPDPCTGQRNLQSAAFCGSERRPAQFCAGLPSSGYHRCALLLVCNTMGRLVLVQVGVLDCAHRYAVFQKIWPSDMDSALLGMGKALQVTN